MTEESELTRRGGRLVYTEDEEGNRTLVLHEPEHKAPEPKELEPEAAPLAAPALPSLDPALAEPSTPEAALKGDTEQKGKRK